jgi:uncharacterized membrane protein YbaN (DUF454 family)
MKRRRLLHRIRDWPAAIRIALAVVCLLVGLVGIVMPILPGWPFLFVGLAILATVFPGIARFWRRRMRKHPHLRKAIKTVRRKSPVKKPAE